MPRNKRSARRRRPENLVRRIEITAMSVSMQFGTRSERGSDPEWHNYGRIELTGVMDEPVRGTRDMQAVLYSTDDHRVGSGPPPCIGYVNGITPVLRPALFVPHEDFDRVWTLAVSGRLKHAYMVITPPRYQSASVLSLSFSTDPEE